MIDGFSLRRGDTYNWRFVFDDGATPPVPINVAGRTLSFTVKASRNDSDAHALVQASAVFPDDANSHNGIGWIFVPHDQTVNLVPGQKVYYDFQMAYYDSSNRLVVQTVDTGVVKVDWDVTERVPTP